MLKETTWRLEFQKDCRGSSSKVEGCHGLVPLVLHVGSYLETREIFLDATRLTRGVSGLLLCSSEREAS